MRKLTNDEIDAITVSKHVSSNADSTYLVCVGSRTCFAKSLMPYCSHAANYMEIDVALRLKHSNILEILHIVPRPSVFKGLTIVLPAADCDMVAYMKERNPTVGQRIVILSKITHAIDYLHKNNVIHLDIKPENVVFVGEEPMLTDFGSSRKGTIVHGVPHGVPHPVPHPVPHGAPHGAPRGVPHPVPHPVPRGAHPVPHGAPHSALQCVLPPNSSGTCYVTSDFRPPELTDGPHLSVYGWYTDVWSLAILYFTTLTMLRVYPSSVRVCDRRSLVDFVSTFMCTKQQRVAYFMKSMTKVYGAGCDVDSRILTTTMGVQSISHGVQSISHGVQSISHGVQSSSRGVQSSSRDDRTPYRMCKEMSDVVDLIADMTSLVPLERTRTSDILTKTVIGRFGLSRTVPPSFGRAVCGGVSHVPELTDEKMISIYELFRSVLGNCQACTYFLAVDIYIRSCSKLYEVRSLDERKRVSDSIAAASVVISISSTERCSSSMYVSIKTWFRIDETDLQLAIDKLVIHNQGVIYRDYIYESARGKEHLMFMATKYMTRSSNYISVDLNAERTNARYPVTSKLCNVHQLQLSPRA